MRHDLDFAHPGHSSQEQPSSGLYLLLAVCLLVSASLGLYLTWDHKTTAWRNSDGQSAAQILGVRADEPRLNGRGGEIPLYVVRIPGDKFDRIRENYRKNHPQDLVWSKGTDPESRVHFVLMKRVPVTKQGKLFVKGDLHDLDLT